MDSEGLRRVERKQEQVAHELATHEAALQRTAQEVARRTNARSTLKSAFEATKSDLKNLAELHSLPQMAASVAARIQRKLQKNHSDLTQADSALAIAKGNHQEAHQKYVTAKKKAEQLESAILQGQRQIESRKEDMQLEELSELQQARGISASKFRHEVSADSAEMPTAVFQRAMYAPVTTPAALSVTSPEARSAAPLRPSGAELPTIDQTAVKEVEHWSRLGEQGVKLSYTQKNGDEVSLKLVVSEGNQVAVELSPQSRAGTRAWWQQRAEIEHALSQQGFSVRRFTVAAVSDDSGSRRMR